MAAPLRFLALFLPVLVLALVVTWLPGYRQATDEPQDPAPPTAEREASLTETQAQLERRLIALGVTFDGQVGIAVRDAEAGRTFGYRENELFPQQSVSKLWVAMTALDKVDEGELELDEPVTIRREDLTVFHQPIRNIVRSKGSFSSDFGDLLARAITRSDNTANDRLLRRAGGVKAVEEFFDDNELDGIRFGADERTKQSGIAGLTWKQNYAVGRAFYEARDEVPAAERREAFESYLADPIDGAAPAAIAEALVRLAEGDLLSDLSTDLLLRTLELTRSGPRRLKGGVPSDWTIGHKTGTGQFYGGEQSGYNDVGLLTSPDGRNYGVAVMIGRTSRPTIARMQLMQQVVRAVVRYDQATYGSSAAS